MSHSSHNALDPCMCTHLLMISFLATAMPFLDCQSEDFSVDHSELQQTTRIISKAAEKAERVEGGRNASLDLFMSAIWQWG